MSKLRVSGGLHVENPPHVNQLLTNKINLSGAAAYQLGNTSSCTITEVKLRWMVDCSSVV